MLFPGGQPANGAVIHGLKALTQQLLGAGGSGHAVIPHAPGNIQHSLFAWLENRLAENIVGKALPAPLALLIDLCELLRVGNAGSKGEQGQSRLLAENKHVIPAGFIDFSAVSQLRCFVDFVQGVRPFALCSETNGVGCGAKVLHRQPENQPALADGGEIGAGKAQLLFFRCKAGDPAMGPAPCGPERETAFVQLPIGTNQPCVSAKLQQALHLHVQKSDAFYRAVAFPDGRQR